MDVVELTDVTFTYSKSTKPAIEDINLHLRNGEVLLITGPSGSGKTTLCRTLNGLIPHFFEGRLEGRVAVNGFDTARFPMAYLSRLAAVLFQDPASQLISPTVYDEIAFGPENYGVPREEIVRIVEDCLHRLRLEKYRDRNPHSLSGGEQQATALGAILAMKPLVYVLDEPTSNLDPVGSQYVLGWIAELAKQTGTAVIIVEHKMEELLPFVSRVVVMKEGKMILDKAPDEVLEHVELMQGLGLKPPQVALLSSRLRQEGFLSKQTKLPLNPEDFLAIFSRQVGEKRRVFSTGHRESMRPEPPKGEKVIECRDVHYVYPGGVEALKGINLDIRLGEFVALVGQNGSGKTTLVKHFNALLKPTAGQVIVFGLDTSTTDTTELSRKVGFCFQDPDLQICCRTVKEELAFGPKNLGMAQATMDSAVVEAAKRFGLFDHLDENPFSLSKGERQKLSVASVLITEPEVLIVDEPTTGQDFGSSMEMLDFFAKLNGEGKTVIVITHDMDIAAKANRVIVIKNGSILLDGPNSWVFSRPEKLQETSLRPPEITRLFQMLGSYGAPDDVLSVDQAFHELMRFK